MCRFSVASCTLMTPTKKDYLLTCRCYDLTKMISMGKTDSNMFMNYFILQEHKILTLKGKKNMRKSILPIYAKKEQLWINIANYTGKKSTHIHWSTKCTFVFSLKHDSGNVKDSTFFCWKNMSVEWICN